MRIESLSTIRNSDHPHCHSPDGDLTLTGIRYNNDGPSSRLCGSGETVLEEHRVVPQRLRWWYQGREVELSAPGRRTHCKSGS